MLAVCACVFVCARVHACVWRSGIASTGAAFPIAPAPLLLQRGPSVRGFLRRVASNRMDVSYPGVWFF